MECSKHFLMDNTSRSMEGSGTEFDLMNSGGLAQEVTKEKNNMWPGDFSCDNVVKNVTTFCPCLKSLLESKVKRIGDFEISLAEKISRQHDIDSVMW